MRRKVRRQLSIEPDEVIPGNRRPLLPQECADARRQSDFELALIEPLVLHNRVQEFRFLSLVEPSTRQKSASKSAESSCTLGSLVPNAPLENFTRLTAGYHQIPQPA